MPSLASPESYQCNVCNRIWEQKSVMSIVRQENSDWKGAQEVSSPTSGQGQPWGWLDQDAQLSLENLKRMEAAQPLWAGCSAA